MQQTGALVKPALEFERIFCYIMSFRAHHGALIAWMLFLNTGHICYYVFKDVNAIIGNEAD